jgi:SHS2 domain-containing protein
LFSKFEVLDIDSRRLKARCWGETYDPSRHVWEMEIKAVTLHRLCVERVEAGWRAQVVFDI